MTQLNEKRLTFHDIFTSCGRILGNSSYLHGFRIEVNGSVIVTVVGQNYGDVAHGNPVVLPSDPGLLQLSINMGSFALAHGVEPGTAVKLK